MTVLVSVTSAELIRTSPNFMKVLNTIRCVSEANLFVFQMISLEDRGNLIPKRSVLC
jgi:hypothetical protein